MLTFASTALLALASFAGAPVPPSPAAPAPAVQEPNTLGKLLTQKAPAMVSIKFLLKSDDGEQEAEASGAIIDAGGLVITSNNAFGGLEARFGSGTAPTPTDIKILIGDDTQGVKAKFLARDTELGLAWIQIDEPASKPYAFIDMTQSAEPAVGDKIYVVSLMGRFFDRAPMVTDGFVTSIVTKPRRLIMPSFGIAAGGEHGLPLFDEEGKVVGVATLILPERDEMEGMKRDAMKGFMGAMVLPAKAVVTATARAREMAKTNPAEEGKKDESASDGEKKDGADKPK